MSDHWLDQESNHSADMPNPSAPQLTKQHKAPRRHQGAFSFLQDDWDALQDLIHEMKKDGVKRAPNVIADEMAAAVLAAHKN